MTATDELRRLLDGRGVEYKSDDEQLQTVFRSVYGGKCAVVEWHDDFDAHLFHLTSAQAVEATLGKRERLCRDESGGDPCLFICSYCDAEFNHPEDEPINFCPNCGRTVRA